VVFWSMGNFLFDNSKGAWGESGIVLATFVKDGETRTLVEVAFQPVALDGKPAGLPRPLTGREARQINRKVMDYSRQFRNPKGFLRIDGDRIAIDPSAGTTESTPGPR